MFRTAFISLIGTVAAIVIVVVLIVALSNDKKIAAPTGIAATVQKDVDNIQKLMDAVNRLTNDVEALQGRAAEVDRVLSRSGNIEVKSAAAIVEIESQFCMNDLVRNTTQQYNSMIMKMVWEKAFPGTTFPTDSQYYPHICNEVAAAARASAPDAAPQK